MHISDIKLLKETPGYQCWEFKNDNQTYMYVTYERFLATNPLTNKPMPPRDARTMVLWVSGAYPVVSRIRGHYMPLDTTNPAAGIERYMRLSIISDN